MRNDQGQQGGVSRGGLALALTAAGAAAVGVAVALGGWTAPPWPTPSYPTAGLMIATQAWYGAMERLCPFDVDPDTGGGLFPKEIASPVALQREKLLAVKANIEMVATNYVRPTLANAANLKTNTAAGMKWTHADLLAAVGAPSNWFTDTPVYVDLQEAELGWRYALAILNEMYITLGDAYWTNACTATTNQSVSEISTNVFISTNAGGACGYGFTNGAGSIEMLTTEAGGFDFTLGGPQFWKECPIWSDAPWTYGASVPTCGSGSGGDAPAYTWEFNVTAEALYRAAVSVENEYYPPGADPCLAWYVLKSLQRTVSKGYTEEMEVTYAQPRVDFVCTNEPHTTVFYISTLAIDPYEWDTVGADSELQHTGEQVDPTWLWSTLTLEVGPPDCTSNYTDGYKYPSGLVPWMQLDYESDGYWPHTEGTNVHLYPALVYWGFEYLGDPVAE